MEPPSSPYPSFPPSQPDDDDFDPSPSPSPEPGSQVEPPDIDLPDPDAPPPHPGPPPPSPPVPPLKIDLKVQTASALLDDRIAFEHQKRRRPITTGCAEIDKQVLLTGGFQRGEVVGLSVEGEEVGVLVCLTLSSSFVMPWGRVRRGIKGVMVLGG